MSAPLRRWRSHGATAVVAAALSGVPSQPQPQPQPQQPPWRGRRQAIDGTPESQNFCVQRLRSRNASLHRLIVSYENTIRTTMHELEELTYNMKISEMERAQLQLERDEAAQEVEGRTRELQTANMRALRAQRDAVAINQAYIQSLCASAAERHLLTRELARLRQEAAAATEASAKAATAKCQVCFDGVPDAAVSCGHVFCVSCVERLQASEACGSCPVCREPMRPLLGDSCHLRLFR
jgi:DNA repair exonuclease SbcCD ATPase subunit